MEIRLRKKYFPKRWIDRFCFLLVAVSSPLIAIFDLLVVLPAVHSPQKFMYKFMVAVGVFLSTNIIGNLYGTMVVDTSVGAINLKSVTPRQPCANGWHRCNDCLKMVPPRSYHCRACKTCILKRDHHCLFTGCCIGHYNFRFFALFLLYMFIGSVISHGYLTYYMFWLNPKMFFRIPSLYKMMCPMIMVLDGRIWDNLPLLFFNLNMVAVIVSSSLLVYHSMPIINGSTSYERRSNYPYKKDLYTNLRSVFGKRMYLVWLSPFIKSDLLGDGANWKDVDAKPLERLARQRYRRRRRSLSQ